MSTSPDHKSQPALFPLVDLQQKIYPRSVSGRFAGWRWAMVWLTQIVFYGLPWLSWNGRQAVLFDLDELHFYVFGLVLQPQDFIYLAALLVLSALGLFFVTAIAGRVWCGYACPQTVYTEIFLWFERHIEGDRHARMRLDAQPWGLEKMARKAGKQAAWIAFALITGLTFVGYFIPIHELVAQSLALSLSPWATFWVFFYGFATYGNAGFLREQVCRFMCPYARFQSALIDMDSMVIAYDAKRGENRGARSRKADPKALGLGDCVDCTLCVQVCPTGIDIRNGLQNECIACAACIDVCDQVMDKMGYQPGLIRYSSGNGIERGWSATQMLRRVWRPRVLIYAALLLMLGSAFVWALAHRVDYSVALSRDRGALARIVGYGDVENTYLLQITNSLERPRDYRVRFTGPEGLSLATSASLNVVATGSHSMPVRLVLPHVWAQRHSGQTLPLTLEVWPVDHDDSQPVSVKSTFMVPL